MDGEKEDFDYTSRKAPLVVVVIIRTVAVSLKLLRKSVLSQPLSC